MYNTVVVTSSNSGSSVVGLEFHAITFTVELQVPQAQCEYRRQKYKDSMGIPIKSLRRYYMKKFSIKKPNLIANVANFFGLWSLGINLYLELFCFLSFLSFVLHNFCSGTCRSCLYCDFEYDWTASSLSFARKSTKNAKKQLTE